MGDIIIEGSVSELQSILTRLLDTSLIGGKEKISIQIPNSVISLRPLLLSLYSETQCCVKIGQTTVHLG